MIIENNAVQGLELETGFGTSSQISTMDNGLAFIQSYKWEMGDVNIVYVPKQLLSNQVDAKGNRIPYKGTPSDVAKKILLAEGVDEKDITPEMLFARFNKDTDIQSLSFYTRNYLTVTSKGDKITKRVLSESYKDENGVYHADIHDKLAGITGAIHKYRRAQQEAQLKASNLPAKIIEDTLKNFDTDEKLVRATKTRIAMEVCVIPVDADSFEMKEAFGGFKGVIYTTGSDNYNKIKGKLHKPGEDTNLDFLEIKITHPVVNKNANKTVNKMQSGMATEFGVVAQADLKPSNKIADFCKLYDEYRNTSAQSAQDLKSKVMDFKPMTEDEALSICKDYVIANYDLLNDEEKEKYNEIVQRFQSVLTKEEIQKITNITFADSPNVMEADEATATDSIEENGDFGGGVFEGLDDEM